MNRRGLTVLVVVQSIGVVSKLYSVAQPEFFPSFGYLGKLSNDVVYMILHGEPLVDLWIFFAAQLPAIEASAHALQLQDGCEQSCAWLEIIAHSAVEALLFGRTIRPL